MQFKTIGESLDVINDINKTLDYSSLTKGMSDAGLIYNLKDATASYSTEAVKMALAQTTLDEKIIECILSSKGLTGETLKMTTAEIAAKTATNGMAASQTGATGTTVGLTSAVKGLWTTLKANPLLLVTAAVTAAVTAWNIYKNHIEEVRQKTQEAADTFKDSSASVSDYTKRYEELQTALTKAKGNEEETYNIKKQLLELQTELNENFGEEYGKIDLVTNAYEKQTEAIKNYNKEAANTFLNENHNGIETATKKMTNENVYSFSTNKIASDSETRKSLQDLVNSYSDKGLKFIERGSNVVQIHLTANPEDAYETLNEFSDDLRELARKLGDEHLFDQIFEGASDSMNKAKSIIEDYGEIYKQSLLASIASDDNKANVFNSAIEAVEAYNEAVLKSEDLYSDKNVAEKRANLETIRVSMESDVDTWGKYTSVISDVFEQANTKLLDFNKELTSNKDLMAEAQKLSGLSHLDLEGFDDSGANESFNKLKESANSYGVSVNELIDALVRLGIVTGEVESSQEEFGNTVENQKSKMIDLINSMSDGFSILDKIYADVVNGGTFDFANLDSKNFKEQFKGLEDEYTEFIETISKSPTDINACQEAFDNLTLAYINQKGILDNVSEETADLTISMLENMGVANAEELVYNALNSTISDYSAIKELAANAGIDLANATIVEIEQLIREGSVAQDTAKELFFYQTQKVLANENGIDTVEDCNQLYALANAAGYTGSALNYIVKIKSILGRIESGELKGLGLSAAETELRTYNNALQKLLASEKKVSFSTSRPKGNGKGYTGKPTYSGSKATESAIDKASKEAQKAKDDYKEMFDYFERRIKVLNDAFENLGDGIENVLGSEAKNTILASQIGILDEEVKNYTDALAMYKDMANRSLSGLDSTIREKIVNGAVELSEFHGENSKEVVEAMKNYQGWSDKIAECTQKLEELKTQIRKLELDKFNNIIKDFTDQFDIRGDAIDNIDKQITLLEEAGELIGDSYYNKKIEQSQKQLAILENQKVSMVKQLNDALNSGRIQTGTDEWLEMVNALSDVEGKILDCKTSIEEFNNELLELNWKVFDRIQTEFENLENELGNLANLFNDFNDIKVSDGKGTWTKEAITTLGLYAQQLELAKYRVGQYSEQMKKLEQDYLAGKYSATEYMDKLAELSKGQWDAINSAEDLEDAIISLNEARVNEEIETIEKEKEAYRELIDAQIELIEETEKLYEKKQTLAEKSKSVAKIEKQLAAMANDDSAATIAKRKKLEEQLADAKKDLADTEREYSVEAQKDALNKQLEEFEKNRDAEIEKLKLSLEEREKLIAQSLETVKANSTIIGEQIALIAQQHGVVVSDAIITSWLKGEGAIASYGQTLSAQSSAFIGNIMGVEAEIYKLQNDANVTSIALSNMFSTRADGLVGQLTASYVSEQNLTNMTSVLQTGLINTLERGYDINGVMSALNSIAGGANSVANAARNAADSLRNMMGAQSNFNSNTSKPLERYEIRDNRTGKVIKVTHNRKDADFYLSKNPGAYYESTYAKGSKDIKKDELAWTQEEGSEIIVKPTDGAILTPLQRHDAVIPNNLTENLFKWGAYDPTNFIKEQYSDYNVSTPTLVKVDLPPNSVQITYDKMFEFNGDFNNSEELLNKMRKVGTECTNKILNDINKNFKYGR